MAVTFDTNFYVSTTAHDISKIVFTSPNMSSPQTAGTRSHILPGQGDLGMWYEDTSNMYIIETSQELQSYGASIAYLSHDIDLANIDDYLEIYGPACSQFETSYPDLDSSSLGGVSNHNLPPTIEETNSSTTLDGKVWDFSKASSVWWKYQTPEGEWGFTVEVDFSAEPWTHRGIFYDVFFKTWSSSSAAASVVSHDTLTTSSGTYYRAGVGDVGATPYYNGLRTSNVSQSMQTSKGAPMGLTGVLDQYRVDLDTGYSGRIDTLRLTFSGTGQTFITIEDMYLAGYSSDLPWDDYAVTVTTSVEGTYADFVKDPDYYSFEEYYTDTIQSNISLSIPLVEAARVGTFTFKTSPNVNYNLKTADVYGVPTTTTGQVFLGSINLSGDVLGQMEVTFDNTTNTGTLSELVIDFNTKMTTSSGYSFGEFSYTTASPKEITTQKTLRCFDPDFQFTGSHLDTPQLDVSTTRFGDAANDYTTTLTSGTAVSGTELYLMYGFAGIKYSDSVIINVTLGEAYNCRLTAWDDVTHSTTANYLISNNMCRVTCAALYSGKYPAGPPEDSIEEQYFIHPPVENRIFKGDTVVGDYEYYYGDFDMIFRTDTTDYIGDYVIFKPMLYNVTSSVPYGVHDFVITFHYSYT